MKCDAECPDLKPAAKADCGDEHRLPRADALEPRTEDRRRQSQKDDRDAEDPPDGAQLPVAWRRVGHADRAGQWKVEDAEGVGLADREMDRQGGRWNEPAAETHFGDRMVAIEERQ